MTMTRMLCIHLVLSFIGILFGISAFVVFFCIYHNLVAGTWAIISGVFAAICFQLHILLWKNKLENYYLPRNLRKLAQLGMMTCIISSGCFFWYLFITIYWHIPMMPISSSSTISAVWSFMTAKWAFNLFLFGRRYAGLLEVGYQPLATDA